MPHDMKKGIQLMVLALAAIGLTACFNAEYSASPRIWAGYAYCAHTDSTRDTVNFSTYTPCIVRLYDTVRVPLFVDGVYHPLTTFEVSGDRTAIDYTLVCDSAALKLLMPDSKPAEGYLHFVDSCYGMSVQMYYIAKVKGDFPLTLSLSSLAPKPYTNTEVKVTQSVR